MKNSPRLLRITTLPSSHKNLLNGQLAFFKRRKYKVMAVSAEGPDVLSLTVEGIPHKALPFTTSISPWKDFLCLLQLFIVFSEFKPNIVHTHTAKAGFIGMLAAWLYRVPVRMHTVSRVPENGRGIKQKLLWLAERLTYACATHIYPNSQGLKGIIENKFNSGGKVKLIGNGSTNGVDTHFYHRREELEREAWMLRRKYNIRPTDIVFTYVGPVAHEKGIQELVEAFSYCREKSHLPQKMFLMIVGPIDEERKQLDPDLLQFLTDDPNVVLAGIQSEIRTWMMASDVFVFPSYREGFPNVVMQASCLELPCIVTDIGGSNEIIAHNETGLLVPPAQVEPLAEAMLYLAENDDLRRSFGRRGRERVCLNFDQRLVWNELNAEYEKLMAQHNERKRNEVPPYKRVVKPVLDRLVALLAFVILSPLFLLCAGLLAYANRGKVFFTQQRPGKHGKLFRLVKFRTMTDERDTDGALLPDDKRMTPTGRFIRNTSLDELPQLLNVLAGDMSLVGPRPLLKEYIDLYSDEQHKRHLVKPGITGWAQVNGRNSISWPERFELDLWYVKHESLKLDMKILWLTLIKVLKAEGIHSDTSVTMERFTGNRVDQANINSSKSHPHTFDSDGTNGNGGGHLEALQEWKVKKLEDETKKM